MSRGSISHSYGYIPTYSNAMQQISPDRYMLKIRQQPIQTRLSTNNERDRRPLDPPPIVQIELEHSTAQETQDFLQNPYLFMCVSLVHTGTQEEVLSTTQNSLSGQTSSSMYKLKDINNHDGGFFVFGDVSVKLEGQFRLKFSMFEISSYGVTNLKSIYSNVFQVYSTKTFPGMLESTFLSRSFSDQGARIRIRKEHRVQMTGSRKRKLSSPDEVSDMMERQPYIDRPHPNFLSQQQQLYNQSISQSQNYHIQSGYHPHSSAIQYQNQIRSQQQNWSPNFSNADNASTYDDRRGSFNSVVTTSSDMSLNPRRLSLIDCRPSVPFSPPHQSYDNSRPVLPSGDHKNNAAHLDCSPYENHHHNQQQQLRPHLISSHYDKRMIPSPPHQSSLFKPDIKRPSLDEAYPTGTNTFHTIHRRQSADPHLYHRTNQYQHVPRRMSLQQYSAQIVHPPKASPPDYLHTEEVIHLPPLRSIVPAASNNGDNETQSEHLNSSPLPSRKHPHLYHQQDGIVEVDAAVAMMQLASRRQAEAKANC